MYFYGSAYGSWEESHITADILSQFVSAKSKIILGIISKIIQIVISIPMVYLAIQMLQFNLKMNPVTLDFKYRLHSPKCYFDLFCIDDFLFNGLFVNAGINLTQTPVEI